MLNRVQHDGIEVGARIFLQAPVDGMAASMAFRRQGLSNLSNGAFGRVPFFALGKLKLMKLPARFERGRGAR
jgi:hypothetical protein